MPKYTINVSGSYPNQAGHINLSLREHQREHQNILVVREHQNKLIIDGTHLGQFDSQDELDLVAIGMNGLNGHIGADGQDGRSGDDGADATE